MIPKEEILEQSNKYSLPPDIIEKDYMLGWIKVLEALKKKSTFKNVKLPTIELMDSMESKKDMFIDWEIMLGHQISDLPQHEFYWSKLPELLEWLYS